MEVWEAEPGWSSCAPWRHGVPHFRRAADGDLRVLLSGGAAQRVRFSPASQAEPDRRSLFFDDGSVTDYRGRGFPVAVNDIGTVALLTLGDLPPELELLDRFGTLLDTQLSQGTDGRVQRLLHVRWSRDGGSLAGVGWTSMFRFTGASAPPRLLLLWDGASGRWSVLEPRLDALVCPKLSPGGHAVAFGNERGVGTMSLHVASSVEEVGSATAVPGLVAAYDWIDDERLLYARSISASEWKLCIGSVQEDDETCWDVPAGTPEPSCLDVVEEGETLRFQFAGPYEPGRPGDHYGGSLVPPRFD